MDTLIQKNVIIRGEKMREVKEEEMLKIEGGASVSAAMLSVVYKTIGLIFTVGEALGSYIRRKVEGKMCDL